MVKDTKVCFPGRTGVEGCTGCVWCVGCSEETVLGCGGVSGAEGFTDSLVKRACVDLLN